MKALSASTKKQPLSLQLVWKQFLEQRGDKPFRRQDIAALLYPLGRPRDTKTSDLLADRFIQQARREGKLIKAGHVHWKQVTLDERVLKSGRVVRDLPEPIDVKLTTRCPSKWLAVDLETGDIWAATEKGWTRAPYKAIEEAREALTFDGIPSRAGDADVAVGRLLR